MNAPAVGSLDWAKCDGLLPAVVQDADTAAVLMLGYMTADAYTTTLASGKVTFFSRSRKTLWTKGETSGNTLQLVAIDTDCDRDTLLVQARPTGPVCHLGTANCFDRSATSGVTVLGQLEQTIMQRLRERSDESYTAKLAAAGIYRIAQKVGEEGVELALAAVKGEPAEIRAEAADLVYHLMVLLRASGLGLSDVTETLASR